MEMNKIIRRTGIPVADAYSRFVTDLTDALKDFGSITKEEIQESKNTDGTTKEYAHLLYCSLKIIREKRKGYELTARLLFLYLIIKHRFRTELVQSNMRVGFYNFAEYQGRKSFLFLGLNKRSAA